MTTLEIKKLLSAYQGTHKDDIYKLHGQHYFCYLTYFVFDAGNAQDLAGTVKELFLLP